jgi:hypothetical protein
MTFDAIVALLTYANDNEHAVRVVLRDGTEVIGTPSSVDTHPTACEVYLLPANDPQTEIGVALTGITSAELL